ALPSAHRFWPVPLPGTATCSWSFCGMASRNARSWLDRFPQAQASSKKKLERIVHSQRALEVAQVLRSIDVVQEEVEPRARHRREARGELPAQRGGEARRQGEEVLRGQLRMPDEVAGQVDERHSSSCRKSKELPKREVHPQRRPAAQLEELL